MHNNGTVNPDPPSFFGKTVVVSAFLLSLFGWGVGHYGPSVFLHMVIVRTGWSLALVSSAVTFHFLLGAIVVTQIPKIHRYLGLHGTVILGAIALGLGIVGWSLASTPFQLFLSAAVTGSSWVLLSAVTVNAIVSTWFEVGRPKALSAAYNGAPIGGMLFTPLWGVLTVMIGFKWASVLIAFIMIAVLSALAFCVFRKKPSDFDQMIDGGVFDRSSSLGHATTRPDLPGGKLWRSYKFQTLGIAMAAGLFAQIGMIAHLFSLLVPRFGETKASFLMGAVTGCGILGRTIIANYLNSPIDRRFLAAISYLVQATGTGLILFWGGSSNICLALGLFLFGAGLGNASSIAPLVAQRDFSKADVMRVVAFVVAFAQAIYSFAPAIFSYILESSRNSNIQVGIGTDLFFTSVLFVQLLAAISIVLGAKART
jgi:MFS family permease